MADEGLLIPIQFTLEEARAALSQLEAQARAAGQRAGEGVSRGVEGGLQGLKKSMGPARESAMFFTQALAELGPSGRTAQIALSGVAGAILGGGGVLAGLSIAQAGARLLADAWNDNEVQAKKAAEAAKKAADEIAKRILEARDRVQQATFKLSETAVSDIFRQTTLQKAKDELDNAMAEVLGSGRRLSEAKRAGDLALAAAWSDRLAKAKASLPGLRAVADEAGKEYDRLLGIEALAKLDKDIEKKKELDKAAADAEAKAKADAFRRLNALGEARLAEMKSEQEAIAAINRDANQVLWDLQVADAARLSALEERRNAERIARERETAQAILSIEMQIGQEMLSGLADSLIHADLANRRYTAQYNALANAQRAQMLLQRGAAKSLAEAQVMVAEEAGAAKAAEAAATKAAEAEKLKAMAIGWALQGAVMAIPGPQFNPAAAAVYLGAAAAAGTAAAVLASAATSQAQGRGFTAQENDALAGMTGGNSSGGAREYGGTGGGGTVTVRETIYVGVVANDFESPAETARRAARVMELAERLNMTRRAG